MTGIWVCSNGGSREIEPERMYVKALAHMVLVKAKGECPQEGHLDSRAQTGAAVHRQNFFFLREAQFCS